MVPCAPADSRSTAPALNEGAKPPAETRCMQSWHACPAGCIPRVRNNKSARALLVSWVEIGLLFLNLGSTSFFISRRIHKILSAWEKRWGYCEFLVCAASVRFKKSIHIMTIQAQGTLLRERRKDVGPNNATEVVRPLSMESNNWIFSLLFEISHCGQRTHEERKRIFLRCLSAWERAQPRVAAIAFVDEPATLLDDAVRGRKRSRTATSPCPSP